LVLAARGHTKAPETDLLILDRHVSLCTSPELLEFAKQNVVLVIMLTTQTHNSSVVTPHTGSFGPLEIFLK
jgi:hypothetical protein